jgi:hypothetical protein
MPASKNPPAVNAHVVVGVLAAAVLAMLASLNSYQVSVANAQQFPDPYGVARAEQRFEVANRQLPPHATIAYVSDLRIGDVAGTTAFLAAQYALAPRLVIPAEDGAAAEWAVGNFSKPTDFASAGAKAGYAVVADFGSGVIVYKKATR